MLSFSGILELIRLPGDVRPKSGLAADFISPSQRFWLEDLLVQPDVVPGVAGVVQEVCIRLGVGTGDLIAFVYASPFLQAECHPAGDHKCYIRLSSALVEALDSAELMFVVGHELGHFLLGHLNNQSRSVKSHEDLISARRRELSVDRIGLVACQSLPSALSAIMKTMSGLSGKNLRFNAASFIAQLRSYEGNKISDNAVFQSHPSWLIRSRALLWFSMNHFFQDSNAKLDESHIQTINARVIRDLELYFDKPLIDEIQNKTRDVEFWNAAKDILAEPRFTKLMQKTMQDRFGIELTDKLKTLFASISHEEAISHVENNFQWSLEYLQKIAPEVSLEITSRFAKGR